ncbi:hypothetical protein SCARD494_10417 [Seiridium cardinale]
MSEQLQEFTTKSQSLVRRMTWLCRVIEGLPSVPSSTASAAVAAFQQVCQSVETCHETLLRGLETLAQDRSSLDSTSESQERRTVYLQNWNADLDATENQQLIKDQELNDKEQRLSEKESQLAQSAGDRLAAFEQEKQKLQDVLQQRLDDLRKSLEADKKDFQERVIGQAVTDLAEKFGAAHISQQAAAEAAAQAQRLQGELQGELKSSKHENDALKSSMLELEGKVAAQARTMTDLEQQLKQRDQKISDLKKEVARKRRRYSGSTDSEDQVPRPRVTVTYTKEDTSKHSVRCAQIYDFIKLYRPVVDPNGHLTEEYVVEQLLPSSMYDRHRRNLALFLRSDTPRQWYCFDMVRRRSHKSPEALIRDDKCSFHPEGCFRILDGRHEGHERGALLWKNTNPDDLEEEVW